MKKIYYLFILAFLSMILVSCFTEKPLMSGPSANNSTYHVEYLFEHDGCKVYRFTDNGNYVYFTNCTGDVTAISNDSIKHRTHTMIKR